MKIHAIAAGLGITLGLAWLAVTAEAQEPKLVLTIEAGTNQLSCRFAPNAPYQPILADRFSTGRRVDLKTGGEPTHIRLPNQALLSLDPGTEVQLAFLPNSTVIDQIRGATWHRIWQPLPAGNYYEVRTREASFRANGTDFGVSNPDGSGSSAYVMEGRVETRAEAWVEIDPSQADGTTRWEGGHAYRPVASDSVVVPTRERSADRYEPGSGTDLLNAGEGVDFEGSYAIVWERRNPPGADGSSVREGPLVVRRVLGSRDDDGMITVRPRALPGVEPSPPTRASEEDLIRQWQQRHDIPVQAQNRADWIASNERLSRTAREIERQRSNNLLSEGEYQRRLRNLLAGFDALNRSQYAPRTSTGLADLDCDTIRTVGIPAIKHVVARVNQPDQINGDQLKAVFDSLLGVVFEDGIAGLEHFYDHICDDDQIDAAERAKLAEILAAMGASPEEIRDGVRISSPQEFESEPQRGDPNSFIPSRDRIPPPQDAGQP